MNEDTNKSEEPMEQEETVQKNKQIESSSGAMTGSIIIILLLIIVGVYVWIGRQPASLPGITEEESSKIEQEITNAPDNVRQLLQQQETGDEIDSIDKDVENTDLNSLDSELDIIDQELQQEGL